MKVAADIPVKQLRELTKLAKREGRSRASVIREAIADYLSRAALADATFGIWKDRGIDSIEYQRELRSEWDQR